MSSALSGETSAATTVFGLLFASATNPVVVVNNIGAVVASTGLITLSAGTYIVESGGTATNSSANVSSTAANIVSTTNLSNSTLSSALAMENSVGEGPSFQYTSGPLQVVTWNTGIFGTSVGLAFKNTYASGVCLNFGWIRVTAL